MVALKLTLNSGTACPLTEIKKRIQIIYKALSALVKQQAISPDYIGYHRSAEITEAVSVDGEPRANPHVHATLLLRGDADLDSIIQSIHYEWPRTVRRAYPKAERPSVKTSASVQGVEELSDQTSADLISWARYTMKGGGYSYASKTSSLTKMLQTSDAYWQALDKELYKLKLIDSAGELRRALSKAEEDYKATKTTKPRAQPTQIKTARPTDWIFLHTIAGYARFKDLSALKTCSTLDLSRELPKLPETVGDTQWNPEDVLNEIKTITLNLSPSASASIAWHRLKAHLSDTKRRQSIFTAIKNTSTTNHGGSGAWYEPKERLMSSPIERGAPPRAPASPSASMTKPS
jgi:hypothetical protein